jgi:hypothetical protein
MGKEERSEREKRREKIEHPSKKGRCLGGQ